MLILRDLMPGTKRFGELKKSIGHVTQKVLTAQLKRLPGAGFLPRSGGFFVSGRQRFLKTQPNCKKSYNFLIKKGGFPLTALL